MEKKQIDYGKYRPTTGNLIVYKPNEWMFVHIPKNGGTSFGLTLKKQKSFSRAKYGLRFLDVGFNRLHNQADALQEEFKELRSCQPVCLTRNPWARCLSLWTFNIEASVRPDNIIHDWSKTVHCKLAKQGFKRSWMPGGFFRDEENMQDGINHNPNRTWREDDPQHKWMNEDTVHFQLETELDDFYDFVGIPNPSVHSNTSRHHDYHLYYDKQLRNEIAKLYAKDIEMFDYTF